MLRINHEDTKARSLGENVELLATQIVHAAFQVHTTLGPGLLESIYGICLQRELLTNNVSSEREVSLPVHYQGAILDAGLRLDLLVDKAIIVEIKAVENLLSVHQAQLITYLKLTGYRLGFLINFNVPLIKDGIKRVVL